jgi:hypothetical protein
MRSYNTLLPRRRWPHNGAGPGRSGGRRDAVFLLCPLAREIWLSVTAGPYATFDIGPRCVEQNSGTAWLQRIGDRTVGETANDTLPEVAFYYPEPFCWTVIGSKT